MSEQLQEIDKEKQLTLSEKNKKLQILLDFCPPESIVNDRYFENEILPLIQGMASEITGEDSLSSMLKQLVEIFKSYLQDASHYPDGRLVESFKDNYQHFGYGHHPDDKDCFRKFMFIFNLAREIQQLFFRVIHSENLKTIHDLNNTDPVNMGVNNQDLLSNIVAMAPRAARKFAVANKTFFTAADKVTSLMAVLEDRLPANYKKFELWKTFLENPEEKTLIEYVSSTYGLKISLKVNIIIRVFQDEHLYFYLIAMAKDFKKLYPKKITFPFKESDPWVQSYIYKKLTDFISACARFENYLVEILFAYICMAKKNTFEVFPVTSEDLKNQYINWNLEESKNIWNSPLGERLSMNFLLDLRYDSKFKNFIGSDILEKHTIFSVQRKNLVTDFFSKSSDKPNEFYFLFKLVMEDYPDGHCLSDSQKMRLAIMALKRFILNPAPINSPFYKNDPIKDIVIYIVNKIKAIDTSLVDELLKYIADSLIMAENLEIIAFSRFYAPSVYNIDLASFSPLTGENLKQFLYLFLALLVLFKSKLPPADYDLASLIKQEHYLDGLMKDDKKFNDLLMLLSKEIDEDSGLIEFLANRRGKLIGHGSAVKCFHVASLETKEWLREIRHDFSYQIANIKTCHSSLLEKLIKNIESYKKWLEDHYYGDNDNVIKFSEINNVQLGLIHLYLLHADKGSLAKALICFKEMFGNHDASIATKVLSDIEKHSSYLPNFKLFKEKLGAFIALGEVKKAQPGTELFFVSSAASAVASPIAVALDSDSSDEDTDDEDMDDEDNKINKPKQRVPLMHAGKTLKIAFFAALTSYQCDRHIFANKHHNICEQIKFIINDLIINDLSYTNNYVDEKLIILLLGLKKYLEIHHKNSEKLDLRIAQLIKDYKLEQSPVYTQALWGVFITEVAEKLRAYELKPALGISWDIDDAVFKTHLSIDDNIEKSSKNRPN
jgi:hypothetical protein